MTALVVGWGSGPWGSSGWGGFGVSTSSVGTMSLVSADAISERQVQVLLSAPPLSNSTIAVGDALNPKTWSVKRLDSGAELVVLATRMIGVQTVELYTLTKFAASLIQHRVDASNLLDASGAPIGLPDTVDFPGCKLQPLTAIPQSLSDFANTPISDTGFGGTLTVGSSGDYLHDSGQLFLRKLVIRRLTTTPNEFFYLTGYGLGIRVKEPLREADVPKLQAAAQLQLMQEPEFSSVRVSVSLTANGTMFLGVAATMRLDNSQVKVQIPVTANLVSL
jgi:hypothetical protein